jgi:uncharacterized membrane protein
VDAVAWVWIVLILTAGVVLVVSAVMSAGGRRQIETPPEHVLKDRFARGEIGEEEYVRRLAVLQHDRLLHPADLRELED